MELNTVDQHIIIRNIHNKINFNSFKVIIIDQYNIILEDVNSMRLYFEYDPENNIVLYEVMKETFDYDSDESEDNKILYQNNGYIGNRMSVSAFQAYENGEKPISRWTKKKIIEVLDMNKFKYNFSLDIELFKKLPLYEIVKYLIFTDTHLTGKYGSKTDFYAINYDELRNLTNEDIKQKLLEVKNRKSNSASLK